MPLVKFEFGLEFLTPAFIGAADPTKVEFTMKSLKSAMRYWWRQFQDTRDSRESFDKESKLFGSTKDASRFSLQLLQNDINLSEVPYNPPNQSGRGYLFYTCCGRAEWIADPSSVKFSMTFRGGDGASVRESLLALWIVQTFGGLGTRSRRGAGSFELHMQAASTLGTEAADLFVKRAEDLHSALHGTGTPNLFFDLVHKGSPLKRAITTRDHFKVYDCGGHADQTLDSIGMKMKDSRQCFTYDPTNSDHIHEATRALHQGGKANHYVPGPMVLAKTAFGLPVVCVFMQRDPVTHKILRYESGPKQGKIKFEPWKIVLEPSEHARRASPLFISINRKSIGEGCTANLLILWDAFLPGDERVEIIKTEKKGGQTVRTSIGTVSSLVRMNSPNS